MILERAGCVEDAVAQQPAVRIEVHQVPEAGAGRTVGAVDDLAVRVLDRRLGHLDARDDPPVSEPDDALGVPGLRLQADGIDEFQVVLRVTCSNSCAICTPSAAGGSGSVVRGLAAAGVADSAAPARSAARVRRAVKCACVRCSDPVAPASSARYVADPRRDPRTPRSDAYGRQPSQAAPNTFAATHSFATVAA